ncbi:MAG: hypothetical protein WA160_05870 [Pseudobdellovibrio sp.]
MQISALIHNKLPQLGSSFSEYIKLINNYSDYTKPYVWNPTTIYLPEINDQQIDRLPWSCRVKSPSQVHNLFNWKLHKRT